MRPTVTTARAQLPRAREPLPRQTPVAPPVPCSAASLVGLSRCCRSLPAARRPRRARRPRSPSRPPRPATADEAKQAWIDAARRAEAYNEQVLGAEAVVAAARDAPPTSAPPSCWPPKPRPRPSSTRWPRPTRSSRPSSSKAEHLRQRQLPRRPALRAVRAADRGVARGLPRPGDLAEPGGRPTSRTPCAAPWPPARSPDTARAAAAEQELAAGAGQEGGRPGHRRRRAGPRRPGHRQGPAGRRDRRIPARLRAAVRRATAPLRSPTSRPRTCRPRRRPGRPSRPRSAAAPA